MRPIPPSAFLGLALVCLILGIIQFYFMKFPVSARARRWLGLAAMALAISGATTLYGVASNLSFFRCALITIGLFIWVPITYNAKSMMMEIWMAVAIGMPLAQYVVQVL